MQLTEQGVVMGLDIFEQEAGKYLVANSGSDGLVKLWTLSPQSNFNKPSLPSSHQNQDEMMLTTTADVVGDAIPLSEAVESLPMEVVHMEE